MNNWITAMCISPHNGKASGLVEIPNDSQNVLLSQTRLMEIRYAAIYVLACTQHVTRWVDYATIAQNC